MKELSYNLRRIRLEKGETQKSLAEKIRLNKQAIAHMEQGFRKPSLDVLEKIADVLGVKVKEFFQDIPDKHE